MYTDFSILLGKTFKEVKVTDNDEIHFYTDSDEHYVLRHEQDCCETVYIESIIGNIEDLVGSPVTLAEEVGNGWFANDDARVLHALMPNEPLSHYDESWTWTFYKLATIKGYVDIRWYGTSNGYYSESVSFYKVEH